MAKSQISPIPPKIYRHFAVVTLLLTLTVAFFADGENREVAAEQIAEKQQETKLRRDSYARFGAPKIGARQPATVGRFSEDDGGPDFAFGAPSAGMPMVTAAGGAMASDDPLVRAGYPRAYLDKLSPEERMKLLESLQASGMLSEDGRRDHGMALAAASARRGGRQAVAD
jgi:hypothetical protein